MRRYFFFVSQLGHLYPVENAFERPFGPTFLKEKRFLEFFYKRIRRAVVEDGEDTSLWPFLSMCGRELNFVSCAQKTPIVFQSLESDFLSFAEGSLRIDFRPDALSLSDHGELYHDVLIGGKSELGLVASSVAFDLMQEFETDSRSGKVSWRGVEIRKT
jgi:hypothetical protein